MKNTILWLALLGLSLVACKGRVDSGIRSFSPADERIRRTGRWEILQDTSLALISPASSLELDAKGDSIMIRVQSQFESGNSFVLTLDGKDMGRHLLRDGEIHDLKVAIPGQKARIGLHKATEAATGNLLVHAVLAESLFGIPERRGKTLEFIGNSITCGAAADTETIPCGTGYYHDQHNAYLAYGPRLARAIGANYLLSSVSGIGIYRNWNDEHLMEPIMPEVYERLYLNGVGEGAYEFSIHPDVVSICLGTNDLSTGDGIKDRKPFDRSTFISNYLEFIGMVRGHHPRAEIVLLSSPILLGERRQELISCLREIKESLSPGMEIRIFEFEPMEAHGCTGHPSLADHEKIAGALIPFFKEILEDL
jgi:hypothetical protein